MAGFESLIARVDVLARGDAVMRAKLETVTALLVRSIPQCDTASVGLVLQGEAMTAATYDHVSLEVDLLQYRFEEGPCLDAAGLGTSPSQVVRIDLMEEHDYQRVAPGAIDAGVTSVLSLPCTSSAGRVLGSLNLYSKGSGSFGRTAEHTAALYVSFVSDLIEHAPVFDAAMDLVAGVTSTVESSAVVNQAVGIIMQLRTCTAEAALALLAASAAARRQDLKAAAEAIVRGGSIIDDEQPGDSGRTSG